MTKPHWAHQTNWFMRTVYDVGAIGVYGAIVFVRWSGLAARWEKKWAENNGQ